VQEQIEISQIVNNIGKNANAPSVNQIGILTQIIMREDGANNLLTNCFISNKMTSLYLYGKIFQSPQLAFLFLNNLNLFYLKDETLLFSIVMKNLEQAHVSLNLQIDPEFKKEFITKLLDKFNDPIFFLRPNQLLSLAIKYTKEDPISCAYAIRYLIEKYNADPNTIEKDGDIRPLDYAIGCRDQDLLSFLIGLSTIDVEYQITEDGRQPISLMQYAIDIAQEDNNGNFTTMWEVPAVEILLTHPNIDANAALNRFTPMLIWDFLKDQQKCVAKIKAFLALSSVERCFKQPDNPNVYSAFIGTLAMQFLIPENLDNKTIEAIKKTLTEIEILVLEKMLQHFPSLILATPAEVISNFRLTEDYVNEFSCSIQSAPTRAILTLIIKVEDAIPEKFDLSDLITRAQNNVKMDYASDIFATIVFICEDLLRLITDAHKHDPQKVTFFSLLPRLPMDLQMLICHLVVMSKRIALPEQYSEPKFKLLATIYNDSVSRDALTSAESQELLDKEEEKNSSCKSGF
jgi:hypothetical protein